MSIEKYVQKIQALHDNKRASVDLFLANVISIEKSLEDFFASKGFESMTQSYAVRPTEKFDFKHSSLGIEVFCEFKFNDVLELHISLKDTELGYIKVTKNKEVLEFKPSFKNSTLAMMSDEIRGSWPIGDAIDVLFRNAK